MTSTLLTARASLRSSRIKYKMYKSKHLSIPKPKSKTSSLRTQTQRKRTKKRRRQGSNRNRMSIVIGREWFMREMR